MPPMVTTVDSNVLLDVLTADATFGTRSADRLRRCIAEGRLLACDIVWAEVAAFFGDTAKFDAAMQALGIGYDPLD